MRTNDQPVGFGAFDPTDVVIHLLLDVVRRFLHQPLQHVARNRVSQLQVFSFAARAHPSERSETVVEAHGPHDVLNVAGVLEPVAFLVHHVRSRPGSFEQEGVPVIEEIRTARRVLVHCFGVATQRSLDVLRKSIRVVGHHVIGLLETNPSRVVSSGPWVVQRRLVRTEVDKQPGRVERFPHVHNVAEVGVRHRFFGIHRSLDPGGEFLHVFDHMVDPTLLVALVRRRGIHLCGDADHAGDVTRLGLGATHASEPGSHKEFSSRS